MRYFQLKAQEAPRLVVQNDHGAFDLTGAKPELGSYVDLVEVAIVTETTVDEVARKVIEDADPLEVGAVSKSVSIPVRPDEVWACGVTYEISEQAREAESSLPDVYLDVYHGERPELFFKATPSRTVGPYEAVGIRADSEWDVPEPELALVLYRGRIVGYTIGNDVSSRSIEGANPLYLPQAKTYDRCCSIGPCVVSPGSLDDPHDLEMRMTIRRDDEVVFDEVTSTAEMVRTCEELVSYFCRHNCPPRTAVLMTGTSLVPDDSFTLKNGDWIDIEIEAIATLSNPVVTV